MLGTAQLFAKPRPRKITARAIGTMEMFDISVFTTREREVVRRADATKVAPNSLAMLTASGRAYGTMAGAFSSVRLFLITNESEAGTSNSRPKKNGARIWKPTLWRPTLKLGAAVMSLTMRVETIKATG